MPLGAQEVEFKTEDRPRLDGGLNSRGSPLAVEPEEMEEVTDYRLTEAGALLHRKYAQLKKQTTWAADGELLAPTLTQIVGGGTLPAATYEVKYYFSRKTGSDIDLQASSALASIAVNLNDRIQIDIVPNNLGEGVGQGAAGADDPVNGGPKLRLKSAQHVVLVRNATAGDAFTEQAVTFAWDAAARVQRATLSAYAVGTAAPAANESQMTLRHIFWHPGIRRPIGWGVDRAILFSTDLATITRFAVTAGASPDLGAARDKNNAVHFWSRIPTRLKTLLVDGFLIAYDGVSRPKVLHWAAADANHQWRLIGANAPASAPTLADNGAGALSAGDYYYKVTYTYRHSRGTTSRATADCESNPSAQSLVITLGAGRQVLVTLPSTNESGAYAVNIYRTAANGTTFFFVAAVAEGTATYADNATDASIAAEDQPPDAIAKGGDGNDVPPNTMDHLVFHEGSIWGVVNEYQLDTSSRVIGLIGTNRVRHSKFFRLSDTGQGQLGGDPAEVGQREQIDAWPARFEVEIGEADPINSMVAHLGRIYIFKDNIVHVLAGTSVDDQENDILFEGVGAMRDSVFKDGPYIYFWDEAIGPCRMDGNSWEAIGYKIQPTWDVDRDAGFYPVTVFKDKRSRELHWILTNISLAPPATIDDTTTFREYVHYLPSGRWTQFTSLARANRPPGRAIYSATMVVLSTDSGRQVLTLLLADLSGRLLQDNATLSGADDRPSLVKAFATLRFFFGDNWQMVKLLRFLYVYYDLHPDSDPLGLTGRLTVEVKLLSTTGSVWHVLYTTNTGPMGNFVRRNIVSRIDWQAALVERPNNAANRMNHERALLVRISTDAPDQKIIGVALKYKDESDQQDTV